MARVMKNSSWWWSSMPRSFSSLRQVYCGHTSSRASSTRCRAKARVMKSKFLVVVVDAKEFFEFTPAKHFDLLTFSCSLGKVVDVPIAQVHEDFWTRLFTCPLLFTTVLWSMSLLRRGDIQFLDMVVDTPAGVPTKCMVATVQGTAEVPQLQFTEDVTS